jgi:hypothetical protein
MAVPGLKDFNRLIDSARSEIDAWSRTPAATAVSASSLSYVRDVLEAIEDSVSIGSLPQKFRLHWCVSQHYSLSESRRIRVRIEMATGRKITGTRHQPAPLVAIAAEVKGKK